jgi:hypothetical protein
MLFDRKYSSVSRTTRTLVRDWSTLHPWLVLPSATEFDVLLGVTYLKIVL